jgi:hypothetical protein
MAGDALIGRGFVGKALLAQREFTHIYDKKTITHAMGESFNTVYCAAPGGTKWKANADPIEDLRNTILLIDVILTIRANNFVLISTVDVYYSPVGVHEHDNKGNSSLCYGQHRSMLENIVQTLFSCHLIVRLPNLVGECATKGPLHDIKHSHNLYRLCPNSVYQWYPLNRLVKDCELLDRKDISLANLTSPPIQLGSLCRQLGREDIIKEMNTIHPQRYDVKTLHGGTSRYWIDTPWHDIEEYLEGRAK